MSKIKRNPNLYKKKDYLIKTIKPTDLVILGSSYKDYPNFLINDDSSIFKLEYNNIIITEYFSSGGDVSIIPFHEYNNFIKENNDNGWYIEHIDALKLSGFIGEIKLLVLIDGKETVSYNIKDFIEHQFHLVDIEIIVNIVGTCMIEMLNYDDHDKSIDKILKILNRKTIINQL